MQASILDTAPDARIFPNKNPNDAEIDSKKGSPMYIGIEVPGFCICRISSIPSVASQCSWVTIIPSNCLMFLAQRSMPSIVRPIVGKCEIMATAWVWQQCYLWSILKGRWQYFLIWACPNLDPLQSWSKWKEGYGNLYSSPGGLDPPKHLYWICADH